MSARRAELEPIADCWQRALDERPGDACVGLARQLLDRREPQRHAHANIRLVSDEARRSRAFLLGEELE